MTSDPAAKGSAKDLEVAGAGPVHCHFPLPPSFLTMCSFECCLSFIFVLFGIFCITLWYRISINQSMLNGHDI